jgi:hypothetical protein
MAAYHFVHEGAFQAGKPHGPGKLTFATGNVYEGMFEAGKAHGEGKTTHPSGDVHEGMYEGGSPVDFGLYVYSDEG